MGLGEQSIGLAGTFVCADTWNFYIWLLKKGFKSNFSCSVLLLKSQMSVGYSVLNSQIETTLLVYLVKKKT